MSNNNPNANGRKGENSHQEEKHQEQVRGRWHDFEQCELVREGKITPTEYFYLGVVEGLVKAKREGCWASPSYLAALCNVTVRQLWNMTHHLLGKDTIVKGEKIRTGIKVLHVVGHKEMGAEKRRILATKWTLHLIPGYETVKTGGAEIDFRGGGNRFPGGRRNLFPPNKGKEDNKENISLSASVERESDPPIEDIPEGSLSLDQLILLMEQNEEQEPPNQSSFPGSNGRKKTPPNFASPPPSKEKRGTAPIPPPGPPPSPNGKGSSHGQDRKPIPKGLVGGRGTPKGLKGDNGRDKSPAACFARQLHRILTGFKKIINHPLKQPDFDKWRAQFEILLSDRTEEEVQEALDWYSVKDNFSATYTPKMYCAEKFCDKFANLEDAMGKEQRKEVDRVREQMDKDRYVW